MAMPSRRRDSPPQSRLIRAQGRFSASRTRHWRRLAVAKRPGQKKPLETGIWGSLMGIEFAESAGAALLTQCCDPPAPAMPVKDGNEESGLRLADLRMWVWARCPRCHRPERGSRTIDAHGPPWLSRGCPRIPARRRYDKRPLSPRPSAAAPPHGKYRLAPLSRGDARAAALSERRACRRLHHTRVT